MVQPYCGILCNNKKNEVGLDIVTRKDFEDIMFSLHPLPNTVTRKKFKLKVALKFDKENFN